MATSVASGGPRRIDLAHTAEFNLGPAHVHPGLLQIRNSGETQLVEPRVMQILVVLNRAEGRPVTRDELVAECWSGLAVSDDAITQSVSKLRRALAGVPGVEVASVPRVGYRLDIAAPASPQVEARVGITRRAAVAGATAVAAAALAGGWFIVERAAGSANDSVAVLPFANLGNDSAQAYLADGISEEVRNALARLGGIKVVGRTSSEALRNADATTAAEKLHVSNVLIGSVRRSPNLVRVAAQLVDGRTGFERWSKSYDLAPGDALELQTEIAESVALALRVKLGQSRHAALTAGGTRDTAANDLYLQAKLAFRLGDTEATYRKVIALCDAALGIDPNFADAWALKGTAWDAIGSSFVSDGRTLHLAYAEGAAAGRRAIALAPQVASGYVALARSMSGQLNVRGALEQYRIAEPLVRTDPGLVSSWILTLAEIGRTAEALSLSHKLIELDPLNASVFGRQAFAYFFDREYELAIGSSRTTLSLAPGLTEQQSLIGDCLCLLGRHREAAAQYGKAPPLDPYRMTGEAFVAARTGDRRSAERVLDRMRRAYGEPISYQVAQVRAQLGDVDEAFSALEVGRRVLDPGLNGLPADPFLDPIRKDARFAALLKDMDFP
ncbi:MAG TPA: winged helix-turn-helix domain-containing protein [Sphingomicrobium sp.]|nr:winged helix-turn-helix domain-containing protein [Sphingomicrobium sp.]